VLVPPPFLSEVAAGIQEITSFTTIDIEEHKVQTQQISSTSYKIPTSSKVKTHCHQNDKADEQCCGRQSKE
jgi:hypothetical protein